MYLLDLHVHFKRRARDQDGFAREQVERAVAVGLDGIALTEHHQFLPDETLADLRSAFEPFKIYSGVEVGCGEDFLVFGVRDESLCKPWADYAALREFVSERGGAICLAHPYRRREDLKQSERISSFPPHAVELRSRNTPVRAFRKISDLADRLRVLALCNSDAHKPRQIGGFFNVWKQLPEDDTELAVILSNKEV